MAFIVVEGLNGSGKTTLVEKLKHNLKSQKIDIEYFRDPGTTLVAESIRNIILQKTDEVPVARCEVLLYEAARSQLVDVLIKPALKKGKWVFCDRFYSSTVAFQGYARNFPRDQINWLNEFAVDGVHPDLVLYLDISVEEGMNRINKRQSAEEDRLEKESLKFQQKVRDGYLAQAKESPNSWLVLDAMQSPDQLLEQVMAEFKKRKWLK